MTFRRVAPALRRHFAANSLILPGADQEYFAAGKISQHTDRKLDRSVGNGQRWVTNRGFGAYPCRDRQGFLHDGVEEASRGPALRACSQASRK